MKLFIKKLITIVKNLIYIVVTSTASLVASAFIFIVLLIATVFALMFITDISQERIREIVLENQNDLEMIVEDLRSYDMPRVSVNKENISTYLNLVRIPDGRYFLGDKGPDFSTSKETQRFMRKLRIQSIDFSLFDELQIVTFEFYHWERKGFYWVDPDTPTVQACISQHHDLTPSGDGWEYVYLGKRYYTEKICDHWYFFELTDQPKTKKQKIVVDPAQTLIIARSPQ